MAAVEGRKPDKVPVMLHNFMMAAREAGYTMEQFREDPHVIAESFIFSVEKYEYDGIVVDVDTVTLAGAVGVPIDFPKDSPARSTRPLLKDLKSVNDLESVHIHEYFAVQNWLKAVSLLRSYFGKEIVIRGNCDQCPFSLASMIRTPQEWMMDIMDEKNGEFVHALLRYCTDITKQFIRRMCETGAHMVSNGDSYASPELISPHMYRSLALPYEQEVVEYAHTFNKPYVLHICGRTDSIINDMINSGADGLELDYKTDVRLAHNKMKGKTVFIGNLDPVEVLNRGTPEFVREKTIELLENFSDTPGFILNSGCAIPASTPPENIYAMIRAARDFERDL